MTRSDSDEYWQEKLLRLPNRDEAGVIYGHKTELDAVLTAAGYSENYFQTSDAYWTSSTIGNYCLFMGSGGVIYTSDDRNYSFGIYVK